MYFFYSPISDGFHKAFQVISCFVRAPLLMGCKEKKKFTQGPRREVPPFTLFRFITCRHVQLGSGCVYF